MRHVRVRVVLTVDQRHDFIQIAQRALRATKVQDAATSVEPSVRLGATVRATVDREDAERALFDFINSVTDWGNCVSSVRPSSGKDTG